MTYLIDHLPALTPKTLEVAAKAYPHMVLDPDMPHHRPSEVMPHPGKLLHAMYSLGDGLWKEKLISELRWLGNTFAGEIPNGKILAQEPVTSVEVSMGYGIQNLITAHLTGALGEMKVVVENGSEEAKLLKEGMTTEALQAHKIWMVLVRK